MKIGTEVNNENIFILGHRGLRGPLENTMPAFRRALKYADGVEFDVRVTGDGKLIVHHDGAFVSKGRMFRIDDVSLSRLRKLHPLGPLIPKVSKVLSFNRAFFNADVKEMGAVEPLIKLVERKKALNRTVFSADKVNIAKLLLKECPDCRVGVSIIGFHSIIELLRSRGFYSAHIPIDAIAYIGYRPLATLIRTLRRRGLRIYLWNYRMDELFWVPRLVPSADAIISNDPARLGKVFRASTQPHRR